jgi:hypothetical protein
MLRILGFLFLLLIAATVGLFGARYYLDRQARTYVTEALPTIYTRWDFEALKRRASRQLLQSTDFDYSGREMFRTFERALGSLKSAAAAKGGPDIAWKSDAPVRGVYADYSVRARFERGEAQLQFVVVKEDGAWRIAGFRIESPAALDAVGGAIGQKSSAPSFEPGNPQDTAAVTASAMRAVGCLDSDAVDRCWENTSRAFKQLFAKQEFVAQIAAMRAKCGILQNRNLRVVGFMLDMPGQARGQYAAALFETTFSRATLEEKVVFYKQDGDWLLSGYSWNGRR